MRAAINPITVLKIGFEDTSYANFASLRILTLSELIMLGIVSLNTDVTAFTIFIALS
ncbi:hypothetical protein D3C76_1645810 [compost metagenome]